MSTRSKLAAGLALALTLIVALGVQAQITTSQLLESNQWVTHTHLVLEKLEFLLSALKDAETGQRGFILTGEDSYLEPLHAAAAPIREEIASLKQLTRDNPAQQEGSSKLQALADAELANLAETITLRRQAGFDAAVAAVRTGRGKALMDEVRDRVAEMKARELRLLDARNTAAVASARRALWTNALWIPVALLVIALMAAFIARRVRLGASRDQDWPQRGTHPWHYLFAVAAVLLATMLGFWLRTSFGPLPTFIVFFPCVLLVATVAGSRPGMVATLLSAAAADYWFIPPYGQFTIDTPNSVLSISIFVATSLFLCVLTGRLQRVESAARVQAEDDYRASEERFRVTLQSIGDAVLTTDAGGRVTFLNPVAVALTGWTLEEALGQPGPSVLKIVNEQTREAADDIAGRVLRENRVMALANHTALVTKDGREIPIEDSAAPIKDSAGHVSGVVVVFHDVAEKRRAQEALRESEGEQRRQREYLECVIANAGSCIAVVQGHDLRYTLVNPAFQTLAQGPMVGRTYRDVFPEAAAAGAEALMQRVLQTGEPWNVEAYQAPLPGKPDATWEGTVVRLPAAEGEEPSALSVVWDITERKRVQEAVSRSQRTFAELVERSPFGTYIVDSRFCIAMMNASSQEGAFRNVRPVIGRDFNEAMRILWPEDVAAEITGYFRHTLDTGEPYYSRDFVNPRHDADIVEAYEWELHRMTLPDGQFGVICYYYDSTTLREAERAQREAEERLRLALEAADFGTWDLDLVTGKAVRSLRHDQIFGYKEIQPEWTLEIALRHVLPEDRQKVLEAHTPADGKAGMYVEARMRRPDASIGWVMSTGRFHYDGEGRPIRMIGVCTDITERKRAEESLRQAMAMAEEANRQKDHFLAVLSHELRNPLAPIRNSVALLKRLGPPDPALQRAREMIDRQVAHMTRLIDDLLDVSRISSGKAILRKEELDLTEVVLSAVEDHRPLLETSGLKLEFNAPPERVCFVGDPARITQIVGNLLTNAGKFTDRGGRIDVSVDINSRNQAIIRVSDTGIGIESEALARLFQPFSQADRSLDRSGGGLGLGLALVKGLVELHGGHVQAASAGLGRGSQFTVCLPGVVDRLPSSEAQAASAPGAGRPQRILVIEDNHDSAETLQLLLEISGHTVVVAHSGPEGLEKARAHPPDIILCDIGLPLMNGYEVAQAIRRSDGLKSVFLVAMTGYGQEEDRRRALEAGFDHHLTKPADPDALVRLLAR